ncbi:retrovirus-related pol polyprotein from transposon TNT 1-94 [Tanacetum coccineum]
MSSIAKFDVEKFDGSNDFGLWLVKMRCLLIQHGWEAALDPFPETMADAEKTKALKTNVYKKAHSALLLCLDNKVLREVNKEDSAAGVWLKLETLYMTKSLANKLYLKKKLFTFYMDSDQALMLLTSLPYSYDNFVETLLYERESLTLEDVLSSLNSRELKRTDAKDDGDGLYVRGRSDHRGNQRRGSSRSKLKGKGTYKLKCYICYFEDHLKKDYPKRNKKKSTGFVKKNAGHGSGMHSEGYDNGDLLMAVSKERFLEWIMDSGGSFHMTHRRDFLFNFKEFNGGTVLLGNNRACAIMGIGKVRVQMKDGLSFVLENVRYIPELKRNLISLGTLDREGYTVKLQNGRVKVIKGSLMVLSGTMKGNCVYSLDGWAESGKASVGIQEKESLAQIRPWFARFRSGAAKQKTVTGSTSDQEVTIYKHWRIIHLRIYVRNIRDNEMLRIIVVLAYITKILLKGLVVADIGKEVEFEVELQGSRVEPTVDPHTGENPGNEDEEQDEEPQQQNLENYVLVHDRAKRTTIIPARYRDEGNVSLSRPSGSKVDDMVAYAVAIAEEEDTHEPITFQEAINSFEKDEWVRAMKEEMSSLKKNHTWELVDQPPGQKLISCKWLYKIKEGIEGVQKLRYKARVVARGFTQRAGIDYNEVFSPVVRHTSIRVILSLTACEDYDHLVLKKERQQSIGLAAATMVVGVYFKDFAPRTATKRVDMKEQVPARKILCYGDCRDRGPPNPEGVSSREYVQKIMNITEWIMASRTLCHWVAHCQGILANPGINQWGASERILKYLKALEQYLKRKKTKPKRQTRTTEWKSV